MSEAGWREFLKAGLDDWVVLHGGPVAVFRTDKALRHAMHIDVSLAREEAEKRLAAALAAGGRVVESSGAGGWILADRAGNKVCIASWPDGAATPEGD